MINLYTGRQLNSIPINVEIKKCLILALKGIVMEAVAKATIKSGIYT